MKTSKKSDDTTLFPLTSSVAAFPVNHTVSQAKGKPVKTNEISEERCSELFAKLSRDGCWQRTYQDCVPLSLDGSLDEFSGTWPASGMILNGKAYQRQRLVPHISGKGSSLWPTPRAVMPDNLTSGRMNAKGRLVRESGQDFNINLADAVRIWPTPKASEAWVGHRGPNAQGGAGLTESVAPNGGKLNPTWVEWLMGFPLGWTDLEA